MEYNDFVLPPTEQLNKINEEYLKTKKTNIQNIIQQKNEATIMHRELEILASTCLKHFELQKAFLTQLNKKTNFMQLKKHINYLLEQNELHCNKFKIIYEDLLPVETSNIENENIIINKHYLFLIKDGICYEIDLIKLLLELKNYETQSKLQSVITNLINDRLEFIKYISNLLEDFLKPNHNSFVFFKNK